MTDLGKLITEKRNESTMNLDEMTPYEIIRIMNREDQKVVEAVRNALPQIEQAVLWTSESLRKGGRIIYIEQGRAVVSACWTQWNARPPLAFPTIW